MSRQALHYLDQARAALERDAPRCFNCQKVIAFGEDYRCWDCRGLFCAECVKAHFGQRHQPHPLLVRQIREGVGALVARFRAKLPQGPFGQVTIEDEDAAVLFRCEEVLRQLPDTESKR